MLTEMGMGYRIWMKGLRPMLWIKVEAEQDWVGIASIDTGPTESSNLSHVHFY